MNINLYDVLSVIGKEVTIEASIENLLEDFQGEQLELYTKQPFAVVMKSVEKNVVSVDCDVTIVAKRSCSRCLEDVMCIYDLHIHRIVNIEKKEAYTDDASESDEISYIEDCTLDIDRLVLDELFTVIPMNVLCKEDCKGICKVCGTNLNKSTCNCDQTVPDPRMAVFSDIFNQFKEV